MNIYDDGNAGDRQSIETVVTTGNGLNYGWIGNGAPVTYSVNIAQGTPASYIGGQVHIMIMPGTGITELAPDYNEANAMVLFIERQTNGVIGTLRYKLNNADKNSYLFGTDTNVFGGGGSPTTNTLEAGYGGLLCMVTNLNGYVGTWGIEMTSDTAGELIYPGGTSSFAFPQESDAQAFTGPVTVYWGVQPNTAGWYQDSVLSSVAITGSPNTLNLDLTQPLNPNSVMKAASTPTLLFTTPASAVYWLQWTLPDANFELQSASSLTGSWSPVVETPVLTTAFLNTFDNSGSISSGRNYNPPPMGAAFDYGTVTANSVAWVSGPTYDAGGSSDSGSLELSWTWDYTDNGAASADFTVDLFPAQVDCSGGTVSFDIMIDPSSTPGGDGDYGYFQVATRDGSYNTSFTSLGEGLNVAAGVGTWQHVSIPLGAGTNIRGLTFQDYNDSGRAINGPETIYIDNLQVTTATTTWNVGGKRSVFITSPMLPSSGAGFFRLSNP